MIVIVEDDPDSRQVLTDRLDHSNIQYRAFGSAEALLNELPGLNPDFMIIDIRLPGMTGLDLIVRLKANPHTTDIPAIAVTAQFSEELAYHATQIGFLACLPKPINGKQILGLIRAHVRT